MEQSPSWEAGRFSASQEIPRILWIPKVHYHIPTCPPTVSILSQLRSVRAPHPTSWRYIFILSSHLYLVLPSGSFLQVSPPTVSIRLSSPHTRYMPRPFHYSRFNHPNNIREQYRSLSSSLCSFLHSPVTSSLLGPNIPLNILFSNTLSVRSSLNVKQDLIQKYFLPFKQRQRRKYNVEQKLLLYTKQHERLNA